MQRFHRKPGVRGLMPNVAVHAASIETGIVSSLQAISHPGTEASWIIRSDGPKKFWLIVH